MTTTPENLDQKSGRNQKDTKFKKGASGNPRGKPRGALNHATRVAQALLDGKSDAITRKCTEMALAGDGIAMRLCLERLCPPRRDRPISFELPPIKEASHLPQAAIGLLRAVSAGEVTPEEAGNVMRLIEGVGKAIELGEHEGRIAALEAQATK